MPVTSASWKASFPSIGVLSVWPVMTIIGAESICAVSMPVTVFVAPGPEVTRTTPGLVRWRSGVAVGHVGGALLVAHQDQLDLRVDQRVEDRHGSPTGEAKDVFDALPLQALNDLLSTRRSFLVHDDLQITF